MNEMYVLTPELLARFIDDTLSDGLLEWEINVSNTDRNKVSMDRRMEGRNMLLFAPHEVVVPIVRVFPDGKGQYLVSVGADEVFKQSSLLAHKRESCMYSLCRLIEKEESCM